MSSQYPQVQTRPLPRAAASGMAPAVDRRARLVLRRLDPWSVLKFSVVFYFCLMLISLLVFAVIWFVLVNMGVFTSLTDFAGNFNLEVAFPAGTVVSSPDDPRPGMLLVMQGLLTVDEDIRRIGAIAGDDGAVRDERSHRAPPGREDIVPMRGRGGSATRRAGAGRALRRSRDASPRRGWRGSRRPGRRRMH